MKRKMTATVLTLLAFAGLVSVGTMALFTDQAQVGANTFATGDVDISTTPSTALVSFSNMAPGDTITDDLVLNNTSSLATRYSISASADNTDTKGLKDQLVLTIKTVDVTTPASPCDNFDGTELYTGDVDSSAGKLVGDSTAGNHTGDRALVANTGETLCFRVNLPTATGNAFQNASTTATFTFDAEQTVNN